MIWRPISSLASRPVFSALVLVLLLVIGAGCGGREPAVAGAPRPPAPRGIVLYVIDTLRADRLSLYGHDRATSPRMDALAKEAVVFDRAHAPGPWTLPSVVSIHTSRFMEEHGVLVGETRIGEDLAPLALRLKEIGFHTASFYCNPYAGPMSGLDRGFDVCRAMQEPVGAEPVAGWLEGVEKKAPFFLYVHNVEPHNPWQARKEHLEAFGLEVTEEQRRAVERASRIYRKLTRVDYGYNRRIERKGLDEPFRAIGATDNTAEQKRALAGLHSLEEHISTMYDALVREADARVGELVDLLRARGLWEETLFIVASDHGEEINDRGGWQHDHSVYEELMRVPLLVKLPGAFAKGKRIDHPVSLVDLMPTILASLSRSELAEDCRGRSLLPLVLEDGEFDRGARVTGMRKNVIKHFRPYKEARGDLNLVVCEGSWKGILNQELGTFELYDLSVDPGETNDVSASHPERVRRLKELARERHEEWARNADRSSRAPISEAARRALEQLGYLSEGEGD